jgi:hypothetical protein
MSLGGQIKTYLTLLSLKVHVFLRLLKIFDEKVTKEKFRLRKGKERTTRHVSKDRVQNMTIENENILNTVPWGGDC